MVKAWNEIDTLIIIKAFKKCCISKAMEGSENNVLFEDESDTESEGDPFADIDEDCEDADNDLVYDDF